MAVRMYADRRLLMLVLFTSSLQAANIHAVPCTNYNITHQVQNDSLIISFSSNALLKLRRTIWCASNSSEELVHGCAHQCRTLGYGQQNAVWIVMEAENGARETCSINYVTELQPASLAYLFVAGDRIRLGISRPVGSFDYVRLRCINDESFVLFNNTVSTSDVIANVECSFLFSVPLMSLVLETHKTRFNPAVVAVTREIPLPVPFTFDIASLLLTVTADAPPFINLNSSYEFNLLIHQYNNNSDMTMLTKVSNPNPRTGGLFQFGLVANRRYTIIFIHTAVATGYTHTSATFTAVFNGSYPYAVKNVNIHQNTNDFIVSWDDPHHRFDWVGFSVSCNSTAPSFKNVYRNTSYRCPSMLTNESNVISIQTQIALPGLSLNDTTTIDVDVQQVPDLPTFREINVTETSVTLRKLSNALPTGLDLLEYRIQCGADRRPEPFNIRLDDCQCQMLEPGTSYQITLSVLDIGKNLRRSKSVYATTLLEKSQYKNHYYSSDVNGNRSVVIEWMPPTTNFDIVQVTCLSTTEKYDSNRTSSPKYFKCDVPSGSSFSVTFVTIKKNQKSALFVFTDTAPAGQVTTLPSQNVTGTQQTSTRVNTVVTGPTNTSTGRPMNSTVTFTVASTIPTSITTESSSIADKSSTLPVSTDSELARWRTYAIIGFIVSAFLLFVTLSLGILTCFLCCRTR